MLPCSFQPGIKETIEWFRQDVVVYKFERDDDDDDDDDSSKGHFEHEQLAGRASILPNLISSGNATLILRRTGLKDRGIYRCHVNTSKGEHNAKVIVKVEGECRNKVIFENTLGMLSDLALKQFKQTECERRHRFSICFQLCMLLQRLPR